MKTLYYYFIESPKNNWGLTTNENEAKQLDPHYKIASIEDINDYTCATGTYIKGKFNLEDGVYELVDVLHFDSITPEFSYFAFDYKKR